METTGAVKAINKAKSGTKIPRGIILHSDHVVQYCSKQYIGLLKRNQARVSMTVKNHCYDNAVAERVNRTLKHDLGMILKFPNKKVTLQATEEAIDIYNNKRYHSSLEYSTPGSVNTS